MKLNLIHKIIISITAALVIFCSGYFTGYSNGRTTIRISTTPSEETGTPAVTFPAADSLININTASREELQLLPGIGPVISEAIIEYREANGNFQTIEELTNVKGISINVFRSIETLITV